MHGAGRIKSLSFYFKFLKNFTKKKKKNPPH